MSLMNTSRQLSVNDGESKDEIIKIVMMGRPKVGKTSICFYLSNGYPPPPSLHPTMAFDLHSVRLERQEIMLVDLSGQAGMFVAEIQERFISQADGIIYVVDSSDHDFSLDAQILSFLDEVIPIPLPMAFLANKQDQEGAKPPYFFEKSLLNTIKRTYRIYGTVASDPRGIRSGENIEEAFHWLLESIDRKKRSTNFKFSKMVVSSLGK